MSILWRSSKSKQLCPDLFLGKHEDLIRKKLYEKLNFDENEYRIEVISLRKLKDSFPIDSFTFPIKHKDKNNVINYYFIFLGLLFIICVSSHDKYNCFSVTKDSLKIVEYEDNKPILYFLDSLLRSFKLK